MTILNKDKHKEYVRFARHCLETSASTKDQETRRVEREMAAEWLTLADACAIQKVGAPSELGGLLSGLERFQHLEPRMLPKPADGTVLVSVHGVDRRAVDLLGPVRR